MSKDDLSEADMKEVSHFITEQWPLMREVLFRPERRKYIEDKIARDDCVFCSALKKGVSKESLVLHVSDHSMVIMNKYPYNNGHLLVLPKKHIGDMLELSDEEYVDFQLTIRLTLKALKQAYPTSAHNIGMNLGRAAGAGIPEHLHCHVIPRWIGDSNFFPVIAGSKAISETLEQTYDRLLPIMKAEGEK
jgi:ATP adenylyltransferase